ncbi:hypothetical protein GE061_016838 [Apolygus lucorum]|uniref:Uncharacterized protein n=1 Tax=Apolygus lucorum TaxID=248454 RepID=A0A6A4JXE4_APOLU|nr:hypothetical protein GE061_016838 [Apolygus lucorum]
MLNEECMDKLMGRFEEVMDRKISAMVAQLPTKEDFAVVNKEIIGLRSENAALRDELTRLRVEVGSLGLRADRLESSTKRNNLIFYGLEYDALSDPKAVLEAFLSQVLGVPIDSISIVEVYRLGKAPARAPLLAKFSRGADVDVVLSKTSQLRGTSFGVNRDYSDRVRNARRNLFLIRKEVIRIKPDLRIFVRGDALLADNHRFTWSEDVGLMFEGVDGCSRLGSLVGSDLGPFISTLRVGPASTSQHKNGSPAS